jgi:KAP family P-loop domain
MDDSSPATPDKVKTDLQSIKDRLLKEDWFQKAKQRENFKVPLVAERAAHNIQELRAQDNLYSLGASYLRTKGDVEDAKFWHSPLNVRLTAAIPALPAAAVILTAIFVSHAISALLLLVLLLVPIPYFVWERWLRKAGLSQASAEAAKAKTDTEKAVRSLIERSIREATRLRFTDPAADILRMGEGAGLSSRVTQEDRISTRYRAAVEMHLLRRGGATVGVTGERGIGKSELLRSFCDNSLEEADAKLGGTIQVLVAVPAAFRGIDFLTMTAQKLTRAVPKYRSPETIKNNRIKWIWWSALIAGVFGLLLGGSLNNKYPAWRPTPYGLEVEIILGSLALIAVSVRRLWPEIRFILFNDYLALARARLHRDAGSLALRLRYAETVSSQSGGSLGWKGVSLSHSGQRSLTSLPLTEGALVSEIESLADKLSRAGYQIVIGIDEMDKLEPGKATDEFLNTVKQLFAIEECSFIVSVSSSAWARFARRGINLRDPLDSSLDVIERIGAFDLKEVRSLILHRRVEMSDSQVLFCYILSGGLPREAMRFARSLAARNRDEEGTSHTLATVANLVLDGEVQRLVEASKVASAEWPDLDRAVMLRKCDYLHQSWRRGPGAGAGNVREFEWLTEDSFVWAGGTLPRMSKDLRGHAEDSLARLELRIRFLAVVRELFCSPEGAGLIRYPADKVVAIGSKLAAIRRAMESDPLGADRALREIRAELTMPLQPGTSAAGLQPAQ